MRNGLHAVKRGDRRCLNSSQISRIYFYGFSAAFKYGSRPRLFLFDDTAVYRLSGYGLCLCSGTVVCFSCSGFFDIRDSLDSGAKLDG